MRSRGQVSPVPAIAAQRPTMVWRFIFSHLLRGAGRPSARSEPVNCLAAPIYTTQVDVTAATYANGVVTIEKRQAAMNDPRKTKRELTIKIFMSGTDRPNTLLQ
jgi:hypothetical protein